MKLKKIFTKAATLALACGALLATSCSGLLDKGDEAAAESSKATVRLAGAAGRSINSTFVQSGYSYQLKAVTGEGEAATTRYLLSDCSASASQPATAEASDFIAASALTATGDSALSWHLDAGSYTFTLDAYKAVTSGEGDEAETTYTKVLSGTTTATLTAGGESALTFALDGVTADLTGSVTLTVDFSGSAEKENVASAKVAFGSLASVLSDENAVTTGVTQPATDATGDTTKNYTVVYTNSAVPAATTQYVAVYFYDVDGYLKGSYGPESVYVYAGDSITLSGETKIEFAALNQDKYPYVIYSEDFTDVTDATTVASTQDSANLPISIDSTDDNYLKIYKSANNGRRAETLLVTVTPASNYILSFDAAIGTGNNGSDSQQTSVYIGTDTALHNLATVYNPTNYLLSMTSTTTGAATAIDTVWTLNAENSPTVILKSYTFYHYTITVTDDSVTLSITDSTGAPVTIGESDSVALSVQGNSKQFCNFFINAGRYMYSHLYLDNIVVKSSVDVVAFTSAAAISGDTTIAASAESDLTVSAAAAYAGTGTEVTPTYAWSLADSDEDYATLSATTGTSVTLTGTNSTINDHAAVVTCVATAAGTNTVTSSATKTVTVKALQSLLSDVTVSAAESATSVAAGSTLTLTAAGGEADDSLTDANVSWAWTSADTSVATVSGSENMATVSGAAEGNTTITVTATLGSIVKTATYDVEVTESEAALSALNVTGATANTEDEGVDYDATVKVGFTATITATTNDNVVPDSWSWESSDTEKFTVTSTGDSYTSTATITGVAAGNAPLTLTATKGSVTLTKTIEVTVMEPTKVTLYEQDFESVTDVSTVMGQSASFTLSIANNDSQGNYAYGTQGSSGGTRGIWTLGDWAVPSSGAYILEFDAMIAPSNATGTNFGIQTSRTANASAVSDGNYILLMTTTAVNSSTAGQSFVWTIADGQESGNTVTLGESTFYHYKIEYDGDETVTFTLSEIGATESLYSHAVTVNGSSYIATNLKMQGMKGMIAALGVDNVEVYIYE